jgi:hypothetical protein
MQCSQNFLQVRGEIVHEFSILEYYVRSYLAGLLVKQPNRELKKYKKQFELFLKFISTSQIQLDPKVLENADVKLMDAELTAAEPQFVNCLDQLEVAAERMQFSNISELGSLVGDLKEAAGQRNIFVHSVWHEIESRIVVHNFPDYHEHKHMLIQREGVRLTPQPLTGWTLEELRAFAAHLRDLHQRLENLFRD